MSQPRNAATTRRKPSHLSGEAKAKQTEDDAESDKSGNGETTTTTPIPNDEKDFSSKKSAQSATPLGAAAAATEQGAPVLLVRFPSFIPTDSSSLTLV